MTTPWGEALTASNICAEAAQELGAIGEGEALADSQPADVLRRLNRLLDSASLDRSKIFRYQQDSGALQANKISYTVGGIGSGADFQVAGGRPLRIWFAFVRNANGVDIKVPVAADRVVYDRLALKSGAFSSYPRLLMYDPTYPLGTITLWPVPTQAFQLFWNADGQLATFTTLSTAFGMPPGYYRWMVLALAKEIAPYFQLQASADLLRLLREATDNLGNYNRVDASVVNDFARKGQRGYDTYADGYGGGYDT